ncbi:MAG: anti-phage dCTP deaminase [Rhodospirillales bacterium]
MAKTSSKLKIANDEEKKPVPKELSPKSPEFVIGLVGYAGSYDSKLTEDFVTKLNDDYGYNVLEPIKLSKIIEENYPNEPDLKNIGKGVGAGKSRLKRANVLQNLGDTMRTERGDEVLALLAIKKIRSLRGGPPSDDKNAFIIDSLKHEAEVELLRQVYGDGFRLVAVHCSHAHRLTRLSETKFRSADSNNIEALLNRDEKDEKTDHGQQVRKVFHSADFFIDNNQKEQGVRYEPDLNRFLELSLGQGLIRPSAEETGMYFAYTAALRSSCLSRQVGAALVRKTGELISTGTNEAPKFGGGVYSDITHSKDANDNRCFNWKDWIAEDGSISGIPFCHNARKKKELREKIAGWLGTELSERIAQVIFPENTEQENNQLIRKQKEEVEKERQRNIKTAETVIEQFILNNTHLFDKLPGIKDIIEYSRSIHAEMNAILNAARLGVSPDEANLYTTVFPCHNCARHIVAAGIRKVFYMEPFVKSLAEELHSDCIVHEVEKVGHVSILPYTGIGPRMYEEHFIKTEDLKNDSTGEYKKVSRGMLKRSVNLLSLDDIEERAVEMANRSLE